MADRRLQVFTTVAQLLSFTKAAETLHMTQPAVTFQIRQLEEYFNTRLFDRTHNGISLTKAGDLVESYADQIISTYNEMDNAVRKLTGAVQGPVALGASTTIAEYVIPRLLGKFQAKFPDVSIRLRVGNTLGVIHMVENNQVVKATASYPVSPSVSRPSAFEGAFNRGETELEVVPQGTLAERLRCGGAGVAAFYTPTGAGTLLAEGKEARNIGGKDFVLEAGLRADFCIIRGHKADTLGNVVYKGTSRNFNPVMATTARISVVEVDEIVEPGQLGPEEIVTPGLYIDRIVLRPPDFSAYL